MEKGRRAGGGEGTKGRTPLFLIRNQLARPPGKKR